MNRHSCSPLPATASPSPPALTMASLSPPAPLCPPPSLLLVLAFETDH